MGDVPEELYTVPIGKGALRRRGRDVTVVATSYMAQEAIKAAGILEEDDISAEVIDLRSIKPIDEDLIFDSVRKTRRLVVADGGWKTYGVAAEISAKIGESGLFNRLKAPITRVCLPDVPAPASLALEQIYYKNAMDIVDGVKMTIGGDYV
jgi:pyruvate dehydrogenase E1 component beta subunit